MLGFPARLVRHAAGGLSWPSDLTLGALSLGLLSTHCPV